VPVCRVAGFDREDRPSLSARLKKKRNESPARPHLPGAVHETFMNRPAGMIGAILIFSCIKKM